jgi:hypothetical protein
MSVVHGGAETQSDFVSTKSSIADSVVEFSGRSPEVKRTETVALKVMKSSSL